MEDVLVDVVSAPTAPYSAPEPDDVGRIERHRLAPVAWDTLITSGSATRWPVWLQTALRRAFAAQALMSEVLDAELRRVLAAAADAGVRTLVIKGAALAYTHYRRPHLRPRSDSDLVIAECDRDAMARVLTALGYRRTAAIDGSLITQQAQWTRRLVTGIVHAIDVHWRVFNPHLFGHLLPLDRLQARAVRVPALGPHALSPGAVDALVLACVHRVAHHADEPDAIWDFDIHLLVSSLSAEEAAEFAAIVAAADLRAVSARGIASAQRRFRTSVPPALVQVMKDAIGRSEQTATFLQPGRRQADVLSSDLAALPTWRARACLVRQHLFPSPAYMRAKYGLRSGALLPFAYARRVAAGVPRWLRPQRS